MLAHTRSFTAEIMDGELYEDAEYLVTLEQIALINRLGRGYAPTLSALRRFARLKPAGEPLRVLDIGFGCGDTLREIHRWAARNGMPVELAGVDLNPRSEEIARAKTPASFQIRYLTSNVFDLKDYECDVMINSLFMHHLNDDQAVHIMKWMTANAKLGWCINDLHRHPIAFHFIRLITPLFGFNRLVCNDAPLSVARSFVRADWLRLGQAAGLSDLKLRWHWPFRWAVEYVSGIR